MGPAWLYRRLHGADVMLQRRLLPAWELDRLRRSARLLLFDLDDAVFLRDSYAPRGSTAPAACAASPPRPGPATPSIAGNAFLAAHAARWAGPNASTSSPPALIRPRTRARRRAKSRAAGVVPLVWVGSSSTLRGLEAIRPMLEEIGRRVPGARLKIICDRFLHFDALPVVECPWDAAAEAAEIAAADVGISWVPDDDWSRGKCGLKVLQYMAAGLPVVANPVGVHAEMVRHGETGFLADDGGGMGGSCRPAGARPGAATADGRGRAARGWRSGTASPGAGRWLALVDELRRGERRAG